MSIRTTYLIPLLSRVLHCRTLYHPKNDEYEIIEFLEKSSCIFHVKTEYAKGFHITQKGIKMLQDYYLDNGL